MSAAIRRVVFVALCVSISSFAVQSAFAGSEKPEEVGKSNTEVQSSASVENAKPAGLAIDFGRNEDGDPSAPGAQIIANVEKPTTVVIQGRADDGNGWRDLSSASITIKGPTGEIKPVTSATPTGEGQGRTVEFSAKFELPAGVAPGNYDVTFSATDRVGASDQVAAAFTVVPMLGIALDASSISFGKGLGPGSTSHASPASIGIRNVGNVIMDIHVSASPLRGEASGESISADHVRYSHSASMSGEVTLSKDGSTDQGFNLKPGAPAKLAYFDIHMPTGDEQYLPADTYRGTITIGSVTK